MKVSVRLRGYRVGVRLGIRIQIKALLMVQMIMLIGYRPYFSI